MDGGLWQKAPDPTNDRIRKELGALTAVLGGLDVLVFTGGIGEHAWQIRGKICANNEWFGIKMNSELKKPAIHSRCDVTNDNDLTQLFAEIEEKWGKLDILVHSIAFAPKEDLHESIVKSSREGFLLAMDISCHSFIRMARLAQPLMKNGGSMFAMSFYGA